MSAAKAEQIVVEEESGPELLQAPKEEELGVYEKFTHPDQEYGWLRDRIKVFQQEGPGGGEPITPHVNGFRIDIPREVECDIPRPFTNNLRDAVETRMEYRDGVTVTRNVPRYHWVMIKEACNLAELKVRAKKYVDDENKRRMQAWEESKNGHNA